MDYIGTRQKKQQSFLQTGADVIKRAEELKKQMESHQESIYEGSTSIDSDIDTSSWKTYRNEKYGFEVKYPESRPIEYRDNQGEAYIRMQNYTGVDDRISLSPGEYYLEIYISSKSTDVDCPGGYMIQSKKVMLGTGEGYRGVGQEGGDSGGSSSVLCASHDGVTFLVSVTENYDRRLFTNAILDTFKFVK